MKPLLEILRVDSNRFTGTIDTNFAPSGEDERRDGDTGWKYLRK